MSRRRRNDAFDDVVDILKTCPWWMSPLVGLAAWGAVHVGVGHLIAQQPSLATALEPATWAGPFLFLGSWLVALTAFTESRRRAQLIEQSTSYAMLRKLTWREFEEMVAEAYRRQGFRVIENNKGGPDGGVDVRLARGEHRTVIQCKNWKANKVGVKVVRELYGVMVAEGAHRAIVICSGTFTKDAREFACMKPIELVGGKQLLDLLETVQNHPIPRPRGTSTPHQATARTCPDCGKPMVMRQAQKGPNTGRKFLGCSGYPRCKTTLKIEAGQ